LSTPMAFANLSERDILAGRYSTFPPAAEGIDVDLELIKACLLVYGLNTEQANIVVPASTRLNDGLLPLRVAPWPPSCCPFTRGGPKLWKNIVVG
jgi:hypothetical protein